ncbi:hypothetical protein GCM10022419_119500 [Nonomuraea rosea]|uniref:DUF998 domain-containing protein n=1 Tax=Nonomuraea rosea TaxID=638574 RepID=A0ABP6ZQ38_9ACTN
MPTALPRPTTVERRPPATTPRSLRAARVSVAAGLGFLALLLIVHLVRTDVSLSWQTTSEYARGGAGWVMVAAFLVSAVSHGSLMAALAGRLRGVAGRAGLVVLAGVAVATAVGGVFVTDPIDTPQNALSTSGTLHGLGAGLALMATPVAALLINLRLAGQAPAGSRTRRVLRWTAPLPLVALVLFMTAQTVLLGEGGTFGPDVPIGGPERVLVLAYAAWQLLTARIVSRPAADTM